MISDLPQIAMFRLLAQAKQGIARSAFEKTLVDDPAEGLDLRAAKIFLQGGSLMHRGGLRQRDQKNAGEVRIAQPLEQPQDLLGLGRACLAVQFALIGFRGIEQEQRVACLLYTSPSPRDS